MKPKFCLSQHLIKILQSRVMVLFTSLLFFQQILLANEVLIDQTPVAIVCNQCDCYSLINSIDYHPTQNLFCVTYTQNDQVILYKLDEAGQPEIVQILSNPRSRLSKPQHAVFSPNGEKIVVANWLNQTLNVYQRKDALFQDEPVSVISFPRLLIDHRPHGMAFSPCGNYLAIAYGVTDSYGKGVALFSVTKEGKEGTDFKLIHLLQGTAVLPGVPKGITFSPDGTCLLVTFSDVNSLVIYNLSENNKSILQSPRQIIQGEESRISRPEDVKISADGNYCAISNSDKDTVTFYPFDKISNRITQCVPCDSLQNPEACFYFPHGISFSPDGSFMLVTQFGLLRTTKKGDITWSKWTRPEQAKFNVYKWHSILDCP